MPRFQPNTAQWTAIWIGAILVLTGANPRFFSSLADYDGRGIWLWPYVAGFDPHYHRERITVAVVAATFLFVWQFARPLTWKSPILIPAAFLTVCLGWWVVGAIQRQADFSALAKQYGGVQEKERPSK